MSTESVNQSHSPEPVQRGETGSLPPEFVKSELMLHTVFLVMAAAVLLMSFLMKTEGPKSVFLPGFKNAMPETCSSKRIFGIACPGCGLTRSFISISHGDVARAWKLNRASIVLYLFVAIQIPWHLLQIWRLRKVGRPIDLPGIYFAPILVVVVLMLNWIARMSGV